MLESRDTLEPIDSRDTPDPIDSRDTLEPNQKFLYIYSLNVAKTFCLDVVYI